MIAIDASAILAILLEEPDAVVVRRLLESAGGLISPVNYWEVLARVYVVGGDAGVAEADTLLDQLDVAVAQLTRDDARAAHSAFVRFGKGLGGPLNLGDCFAYALAQKEGDGLLFKGTDFGRTNIKAALP